MISLMRSPYENLEINSLCILVCHCVPGILCTLER